MDEIKIMLNVPKIDSDRWQNFDAKEWHFGINQKTLNIITQNDERIVFPLYNVLFCRIKHIEVED